MRAKVSQPKVHLSDSDSVHFAKPKAGTGTNPVSFPLPFQSNCIDYGVIFLDEIDKLAATGGETRMQYNRGTQYSLLKLIEWRLFPTNFPTNAPKPLKICKHKIILNNN